MQRRDVTIVPRRPGPVERGRETIVDGTPIPGIRAMRKLQSASEETEERDVQVRTYRYLMEARHPETGAELVLTGWDRILDDGETFEILGDPEPAEQYRRARVHHLEFTARKIGGNPAGVGS